MTGRLPEDQALWVSEGVNHMSSVWHMISLLRKWPRMRADLKTAHGYVRHRVFFESPLTIGLMVWWRDEFDAWRYAKHSMHEELTNWANNGASDGGWLILYRAQRLGPVWLRGADTVQSALGQTPSDQ